jgi:uncharacterized protein
MIETSARVAWRVFDTYSPITREDEVAFREHRRLHAIDRAPYELLHIYLKSPDNGRLSFPPKQRWRAKCEKQWMREYFQGDAPQDQVRAYGRRVAEDAGYDERFVAAIADETLRGEDEHKPPGESCTCGIYAGLTPALALKWSVIEPMWMSIIGGPIAQKLQCALAGLNSRKAIEHYALKAFPNIIFGRVELHGRVLPGAYGEGEVRGEAAELVDLYVQEGARKAEHVRDRLQNDYGVPVTLCDGIPPSEPSTVVPEIPADPFGAELRPVLAAVLERSTSQGSAIHGLNHWRRVAENGRALASETEGADPLVVGLFAIFHDAMRRHDGEDPDHGSRGAMLVAELRSAGVLELDDDRARLLELACRTHADGTTSSDPTVAVCFDADRLDLGRVGIRIDLLFLSTEAARSQGTSCASTKNREFKAPMN